MKLETALKVLKAIMEAEKNDCSFLGACIQFVEPNEDDNIDRYEIILDSSHLWQEHIVTLLEILKDFPMLSFRFRENDRLVIQREG